MRVRCGEKGAWRQMALVKGVAEADSRARHTERQSDRFYTERPQGERFGQHSGAGPVHQQADRRGAEGQNRRRKPSRRWRPGARRAATIYSRPAHQPGSKRRPQFNHRVTALTHAHASKGNDPPYLPIEVCRWAGPRRSLSAELSVVIPCLRRRSSTWNQMSADASPCGSG